MPLSAGSRLGPYEILAPLGAGGMGEVYKARDTRLDRTVAIKVLPSEFANDPDRRARFEREARAIAALDHPRICALHDVGEHDGIHFLVMQHLDGETLAARLARSNGPLPLDQVLKIAIEIAEALDKAHRADITHRDLKPANVMLTKSGAKLLDFGLAKLRGPAAPISMSGMTRLATSTPATAHGTILGTVHYMAPELVEGKEADARSDIWALGAVIYEMATGARPFDGESPASIIGSILKDTPPPVSARQPLAPPTLDHIVGQALDKDPDERWQSAGDVKRELMWLATSPAASPSGVGATRGGRYAGWVVAAALAVALAATAPSAVRRWLATAANVSAIRFAVFPPENATLTASAAALPAAQIAISPDGKRLALVATPQAGRPMLWIRSLDNLEMQMLPGTEEAAFPFWSPDSRFVGFFAQGKLKRTDLVGGAPQALCDVSSDAGRGATWNRDGIIVFVPDSGSGMLQVSDAGGRPTPAIALREGDSSYRWPSFLSDGRHLLFVVRGSAERRGLYVGTLGETAITRLLDIEFNAVFSMGHLLTLREGTLLAYPFDETRLQIMGSPVPVAERVGGTSTQMAALSVSTGGVLAYGGPLKASSRLTWFDRDGRSQGTAIPDAGDYSTFRFSVDERHLAFTQVDAVTKVTQDIWLLDVARGVSTRFTSDRLNDISPVWSPDSEQIVFRSDRAGGNFLFQKPSTGAASEQLIAAMEVAFPTDWSPDGRFILYYAPFPTTGWDVMALPLSGERKPIAVSQTRFAEVGGRFAANGRWIAYASDESGRSEIYVQPFPQSGSRVRVTTSGAFEPRWRRDGKELFYLALDGTLTAVPVNAGATFESGPPQRLFQTRVPFLGSPYRSDYEVVSDGRRFLVNTLVEGAASAPITVVLNWTAGLK